MEFHKTTLGKKYYEGDVPRIMLALERIAKALEEQNKMAKDKVKLERKKSVNESDTLGQIYGLLKEMAENNQSL